MRRLKAIDTKDAFYMRSTRILKLNRMIFEKVVGKIVSRSVGF